MAKTIEQFVEHHCRALKAEAKGLAWRSYDIHSDRILWRFKAQRWNAPFIHRIYGFTDFPEYSQAEDPQPVAPYCECEGLICIQAEKIIGPELPLGATCEAELEAAEALCPA